jgi:sugar-specific transcriptional regulator TrmB
MTDPVVSLTAAVITELAIKKIVESGAGELTKKFTAIAIDKMGELWEKIKAGLTGKNPKLDESLQQAETGDKAALNTVSKYLDMTMEEQPEFANELQILAREINAGRLIDQSSMTMNVYNNAQGWQTKVEGGTAYIGEIHNHGKETN